MVTNLDRIVGSTAGMAGALYVLAALIFWYLIVFKRDNTATIYDRAVAWSSMAVLFFAITAGRMRWVDWYNVAWAFVVSTSLIMLAGLVSVRAITGERFGNLPLLIFAAVVFTSGVSIFLWG